MDSTVDTDNATMNVKDHDALQKLVNDYIYNTDESLESCRKDIFPSFQLAYSKNPLLHIVDALSSALTDINVEKRAKGTALLAECIHQYKPASMDEMEIETLVTFFCDRLKDHHSIQPMVIYAFLGLISYQNIKDHLIITMLQSVFSEVHVQSLVQADRRNIFNIFSNLLKSKIDVLKIISSDFVFGFIQTMDCERDPRNLLLCFENSYLIIKELDISIFTEDLFEVLSCYFPVEFQEPKEDKFRIKKEDLVDSLRKCLTAEKTFAPFAIPLFLEKLSSDMMESKLESLITFTECLKIYKPEDVALFIDDIWLGIRKDYLLSDYKELDAAYLEYIYFLIKCLSKSENKDALDKIVDFLVKDCVQTLKDPEMVIAIPCGNVILKASNASHQVFDQIIDQLLSPIRVGLEKYTSVPQRTSILEIITKVLSIENENITPNASLVEFVDYLVPLLFSLLSDGESITLQILSLRCLRNVITKSVWFKTCDFDILSQHCFCPVLEKVLPSQLLIEYRLFVEILSDKFPLIYQKQYLETLAKRIGNGNEKVVSQCLALLQYTSLKNDDLREKVYSYFNTFVILETNLDGRDNEVVLQCYINILRKNNRSVDGKLFFLPLIKLLQSVKKSMNLLLITSHLLSESFRLLNEEQRKEMILFLFKISSNQYKICDDVFGSQITLQMEDNLLHFSVLLRGVSTQLKSNELNEIDIDSISRELIQATGRQVESVTLQNVCIVLGSILNKLPADSPLIKKYLDIITKEQSHSSVVLLSWVTKGLVLNWQSSTSIAIDSLLNCLNNAIVANVAANAFQIIVKDVKNAFTKESFSVIKLMYKQRYTQYVLPLLIQRYYDGEEDVKSFHMIAISNTLPAIPKQLLQKHLKSMIPLLMHSLVTCDTSAITESTLATITSVLEDNKDAFMEYVPSLLSSLLNHIKDSNMNIRILSLNALSILSTYTSHVVQPMRSEVILKIRSALDDKKRLVRKQATFCSSAWHLMSSGNE